MSSLRISEIFTSVQGEGRWVGMPSTFVRVSGCNLRCAWCDTPYASWRPEGPTMSVEAIFAEVQKRGVSHVVVTGGEPMLFEATETLCRLLAGCGFAITIETAGTVFRDLPCDLMSISPKLANSTPDENAGPGWKERHESTRLDLTVLKSLMDLYDYQLKFVVNPDAGLEDLAEIEGLLSRLENPDPQRVLLMAEGTDADTLSKRQRLLVEPCIQRGWRLTPRMHVDLFGNTRGT